MTRKFKEELIDVWAKLEKGPYDAYLQAKAYSIIMIVLFGYAKKEANGGGERRAIEADMINKAFDLHEYAVIFNLLEKLHEGVEQASSIPGVDAATALPIFLDDFMQRLARFVRKSEKTQIELSHLAERLSELDKGA